MGFLLSNVFGLEKGARFFFYVHYIIQIHFTIFCMSNNHYYIKNIISFNFPSPLIIFSPIHFYKIEKTGPNTF